jgi:hypothetical protein
MITTTVASVSTVTYLDQYSLALATGMYMQFTGHEDVADDADEVTGDPGIVEFVYGADYVSEPLAMNCILSLLTLRGYSRYCRPGEHTRCEDIKQHAASVCPAATPKMNETAVRRGPGTKQESIEHRVLRN